MFNRPKNQTERLALRPAFIPKDARPILEHSNGSALYVYESRDKFLAIAFWGTSAKPLFHYSYRTEDQRNAKILEFKSSVEHSVEFRAKRSAARKSDACTLNVGDIVATSWGYDQTNVDFYIVTRRTDSSVWVRAIVQDTETTGYMSGRCWPKMPIEMVGDETMHRARGNSTSIKGHSASIVTDAKYFSSYA